MLAVRLQRFGRKGYPVYRLAVQESHRNPTSGRVVAYIGSYNPHTKEANIQIDDAQRYLDNGAQPTPRVAKLLEDAGVKLPKWVKMHDSSQQKDVKNPEKLRRDQPKEEVAPQDVENETPVATDEAPEEPSAEPAEEA